MDEFAVPAELQVEVADLVETTRGDIVECEADQYGCP
jgi:hypothetical protein